MNTGYENLEVVFRDASDPILIENLDGIVIDLNEQAERTYGFSREELIGQPIKRIVPAERHQQADELLQRCRAGEQVRDVEGLRITSAGKLVPVLLSLSLLKDDAGNAEAIATFAKDIGALRRTETELRQITGVFRDATDPILIEDLDGLVINMNDEAERAYGFAREDLIGKPIKAIVPENRHTQADELLVKCRAGEDIRNIEGVRIDRTGNRIPVLLSLSLLKDDSGDPCAIASFAKDITSLRQSEAEAKRLSRVFMDAADPMVIEDLSGNVITLNREAERAYGWDRDDLIGKPIKLIVPEDRHGQADELLRRCLAGDEVRNVEGLRVSRDGEIFDVLITLSLLFDENGEPMGIASIAKDIGPLRAAEEQNRQLSRVFRDAADPILLERLDGIVFDLNTAAERLYGWSRDELIGKPIKVIVPESRHDQADEILVRCTAGDEVRNVEGLRVTKDGTEIPVLITLSLLKDESGQPTAVASFAKEITAQKRAEADLRQLAEQLEARIEERTAEIERANQRLTHELAVARELSNAADREHEAVLLGESISVRSLRENIHAHGQLDDPLLLTGPAGAGHEAVARALHRASPRASRPFIYVDVASAGTAEDSLFDTRVDDSGDRVPGKASLADGGTLYLAGIDRLSPAAQASLLGFLRQAYEARKEDGRPVPDIRLVAYTSRDLTEETRQGRFDAELEREIGRRRLAIPSLAERRDDILPIAERITLIRARSMGKVLDGLTDQAGARLLNYSWPGNVEELQNVLERAVVLANGTQLDIPEELLREGPKVGSYTLIRQLGSGAMGEVWLARHALLARPAAVKLIRKQAMEAEAKQQDTLRARFQREARSTAQLRSPNTVELYDFGVCEDGSFYYVMEHLTGIDLQRLVEKFGALPPARAIHLISQACLSLAEAHEAGLIHRDIKPSNLFACKLGKTCDIAKVLDFGVVRLTKSQDQLVTATGQLSGTPASMAPELMEGTQADPAADIYGLGCVAYWLLTGRIVFEAPNVMALMIQHATKAPEPPSLHASAVSADLDEVVLQCLAKDPADRPASVMELRERLLATSEDEVWNERAATAWWDQHLRDLTSDGSENSADPYGETVDATIDPQGDTNSDV